MDSKSNDPDDQAGSLEMSSREERERGDSDPLSVAPGSELDADQEPADR